MALSAGLFDGDTYDFAYGHRGSVYPKLTDSGVAVVCHVNNPSTVMAGYSVSTGAKLWERTGSEDSGKIVQYQPLLAQGGKLLCWVSTYTHRLQEYGVMGILTTTPAAAGYTIDTFEAIPEVKELFPVFATHYEVIDILSGDTLATRSLDLGDVSFEVLAPTGDCTLETTGPDIAIVDYEYSYDPIQSHISMPGPIWIRSGGDHWDSVSLWPRYYAEGHAWVRVAHTGGGEDLYEYQYIKNVLESVAVSVPIPPPHSIASCCVSADGKALIFAPNPTPAEDLKYTVLISGVITDVPWGAPHQAGHDQYCVALNWDADSEDDDLLDELWSVSVGPATEVGRPVAAGDEIVLPYAIDPGDGTICRFRRLDPMTGDTIADMDLPSSVGTSGDYLLTSKTKLLRAGTILNAADPTTP